MQVYKCASVRIYKFAIFFLSLKSFKRLHAFGNKPRRANKGNHSGSEYNHNEFLAILDRFWRFCLGASGHTDGQTDIRTDSPSYRHVRTHLKMRFYESHLGERGAFKESGCREIPGRFATTRFVHRPNLCGLK